ncbi:IS30 family transposase [Leuconostoc citreum]
MGRKYLQLSYRERQKIETLREEGYTYAAIAERLNRSISTIHNEIKRNTMRPDVTNNTKIFPYNADWAEVHSRRRRSSASRRKVRLTRHWQKVINGYLEKNWSLEQVALGTRVPYTTNTLYNYAKDGYLRYKPKKYRLKKKKYHGVKTEREVFSLHHISLRPQKIENRTEFGHWEIDGVEGPRGSDSLLLTFLERKTRYLVAVKSRSKTNKSINSAMNYFFSLYGNYVKSCTFDRGNEFTNIGNVMNITHAHGKQIYFTDAFAPWQRGSNEERNSRIREYYPKGTSFSSKLQMSIDAVMKEINSKPMKVLDWHSPQFKFDMVTRKKK